MKKTLEIFQIDVFTKMLFKGNPAAVIFGDLLNKKEMKLIAKKGNFHSDAWS